MVECDNFSRFRKHSEMLTQDAVHADGPAIDQSEDKGWAGRLDIELNDCAQLIASGGNEPTQCAPLDLHGQTTERIYSDSKLRQILRITLSRASCQVCKLLIAAHKAHFASCNAKGIEQDFVCPIIPNTEAANASEPTSSCIRILLAAVRQACTSNSALDPRRLLMCAELVAAEELPQAARWHRRDLAPGLIAAWRAVLRALTPPPGAAAVLAAAISVRKEV
mmetsp:Transcript_13055/g.27901  ORF Transcript_13055/g.27901 Transcript_13055/m.27901 type:complete len:222 (-) Transcript_13055:305-970(-)